MRLLARAAAAALLVTVGLTAPLAEDYPRIDLRFGHFAPSRTSHGQVDQWFADEVAKRSNGKVNIRIYWSEAVGKSRELLDLAGQGAVDISAVPASYFPARLPLLSAPSSLPLALPSLEKAQEIMHTLWNEFPAMQDEARKANVWPLFFHPLNPYHLLCTSPIAKVADLKGKKVRTQGEDLPRVWAAVGAVPVTVLPGEFYESLQRGSIDCMLLPWDLMVAFKLHEVAKYGSTINLGSLISNPQWYGLRRWEQLPPNVRELLQQVAKDALAVDIEKAKQAEQAAIETMKAAGVSFIPFEEQEKFEGMLPDLLGDWVAKMEKLGQGKEAAAIARRWKELR